jgi:hypothetical protein
MNPADYVVGEVGFGNNLTPDEASLAQTLRILDLERQVSKLAEDCASMRRVLARYGDHADAVSLTR